MWLKVQHSRIRANETSKRQIPWLKRNECSTGWYLVADEGLVYETKGSDVVEGVFENCDCREVVTRHTIGCGEIQNWLQQGPADCMAQQVYTLNN